MDHLPQLPGGSNSTVAGDIIGGLVPTRRFASVSFDSYQPDPRYPSQHAARDRLRQFASEIGQSRRAHILGRLIRSGSSTGKAIYLDGGYGVGKTHLLAATYHAVADHGLTRRHRKVDRVDHPERAHAYLSFGELAYTIARLGLVETLRAMDEPHLLCIDEFELDDVAQTRMAAMFLGRLLERRGAPVFVVTTSNTLPSDLGQGRFAADAFQREIGEIAGRFEVVSIDGVDYRHRQWDELAGGGSDIVDSDSVCRAYADDPAPETAKVLVDWSTLAAQLEAVHPVHYAQIARRLGALYVHGLGRIDDQAVALRLVHFVDKLYDQKVRLAIATRDGMPLAEVLSATYRHGGYEKKYRRCLSRLHELVSETRAARVPPR